MSEVRKVVSVVARQPIMLNSRMVRGINQESLTVNEIRQCLLQHAIVSEILPTGERLVLDFTNFDKVNFEAAPAAAPAKEVKKEEPDPEVKPEVKNPPKEDIRPEKKEQEEKEEAPAVENKKRK